MKRRIKTGDRDSETDANMIATLTLRDYFRYIFATIFGKCAGDRVRK